MCGVWGYFTRGGEGGGRFFRGHDEHNSQIKGNNTGSDSSVAVTPLVKLFSF